jgi:hypothetical protein
MTSCERVLAACEFRRPDRIPRFDSFQQFTEPWRARLGDPAGLTDLAIRCPDEGTFPTRAKFLKVEDEWIYEIDCWGRTIRRREGAWFAETLAAPLGGDADIDKVRFDPPDLDSRYRMGAPHEDAAREKLRQAKARHAVFGKTGGPYLRSTFVRGETQFLMDLAADASLAKAIADKVADHLLAVGLEEIRRWDLQATGVWIYDDMACNRGPMFSPDTFEQVFLPAYRRMIAGFKQAGARYVFLHSDGDIRLLLDMLVDAGVDGINPLERRAGMDIETIRSRYPRLVLTGGMDNTDTLRRGPAAAIRDEARSIIDLGRDGGVIIGTHSIGPDIPLEHFLVYHDTCMEYGNSTPPGETGKTRL